MDKNSYGIKTICGNIYLVSLFLQYFHLSHVRHWWFYGVHILGQKVLFPCCIYIYFNH